MWSHLEAWPGLEDLLAVRLTQLLAGASVICEGSLAPRAALLFPHGSSKRSESHQAATLFVRPGARGLLFYPESLNWLHSSARVGVGVGHQDGPWV